MYLHSTQHNSEIFCVVTTTGTSGRAAADNYVIFDLTDSININCLFLNACVSRITLPQGNAHLEYDSNMEDKAINHFLYYSKCS